MSALIEKHVVKITIAAAITLMVTLGTAIWQTACAYYTLENHETRLETLEDTMRNVATKGDIQMLKIDLKDYINKQ